jgi:hypothetical protein
MTPGSSGMSKRSSRDEMHIECESGSTTPLLAKQNVLSKGLLAGS